MHLIIFTAWTLCAFFWIGIALLILGDLLRPKVLIPVVIIAVAAVLLRYFDI
jgi:hypothetical protein